MTSGHKVQLNKFNRRFSKRQNSVIKVFFEWFRVLKQLIDNKKNTNNYETTKSIFCQLLDVFNANIMQSTIFPFATMHSKPKTSRVTYCAKVSSAIDPRQFARAGHSTTDALIYLLQAIYEALDTGNCDARLFFADFSKGFDMIDHEVLVIELRYLSVHPVLINWTKAFLTNRTQAVRIGGTISDLKSPKGGIPQGTKLGVILFTIMTNNLLRSWKLRIKLVDDTTALEIIPRNSISLLNFAANDIHRFSVDHRMRLNLVKCKDMLINFMHNHNFILNSIVLGNNTIETVNTYKLLGVHISSDLKWNCHVEYITKKANKRIYSIRILKHSGAPQIQLVKVYVSLISLILEYAVPAWQNIPDHLQDKIERVQKRALRIIFPDAIYSKAMLMAGLITLKERRESLCVKYVDRLQDISLSFLLPKVEQVDHGYQLTVKRPTRILYGDRKVCRTERSSQFLTFKF